jgi:hypothetical protein
MKPKPLVPEFRATEPLHMKKAVDDLIAKLNNGGPGKLHEISDM